MQFHFDALTKSRACGPFGAPPKMHVFLICVPNPKSLATC